LLQVKITTSFPECFKRQTPENSGVWQGIQFYVNEHVEACDYWVIYEGLPQVEHTICPPENIILITGEPPSSKVYDRDFIRQFNLVVTSHRQMEHFNILHTQQALPWHIASRERNSIPLRGYDDLLKDQIPKPKLLSVISSDLEVTEGHAKRKAFVHRLKQHFGDRLDVFGRGIRDIEDKWDAIAPYQYHIVLENSSFDNYWTEKLSDCYLGNAFPFYYGCPNIGNYFPGSSYRMIDIERFDEAIDIIESTIKQETYQAAQASLQLAKRWVMNKYNVFQLISELCDGSDSGHQRTGVSLYPEAYFASERLSRFEFDINNAIKSGEEAIMEELVRRHSYEYAEWLRVLFMQEKYITISELPRYPDLDFCGAYFFIGRALKGLKRFEEAVAMLERYISNVDQQQFKAQDTVNNRGLLISAHFHLGEILYTRDPMDAKGHFEKCLELSRNNHQKAEEYIRQMC